jgi:hypothetical protein
VSGRHAEGSPGRPEGMTFAVGEALPVQEYAVTRADLVRYAGASGDLNPIHWSDRVANEVGLPGVIAHGMFTMALVVPDDDTGTVLRIAGTVKSVDEGLATVTLEVTCAGEKVLGMPRAVIAVD